MTLVKSYPGHLGMMSAEEKLDKLHKFYNFPFLNDESFSFYLKKLKMSNPVTPETLQTFILKAQVAFYITFIDPSFDASILLTLNKAKESKCPFASKLAPRTEIPIAITNKFPVHDDKNDVMCIKSPSGFSMELNSAVYVESDLFTDDYRTMYIIPSDSSFKNAHLTSESHESGVISEIFKTKQIINASDLLFLFPKSVLVIDRSDINLVLNLHEYFEILGLEESLENFKSTGIGSKNLPSSQLEPYADLLTVEYIRDNPEFFK